MKFVGVDIETTGLELEKGNRLIQLGMDLGSYGWINHDVLPDGDINISAEALAVNKFTLARIGAGMPRREVDQIVAEDLARHFKRGELHAVGWNVGSFDLHFMKKELPEVAAFFSHRVVDLTPLAMLSARMHNRDYRLVKADWQALAEAKLGGTPKWHDARWDACAALTVWEGLKEGL